MPWLIIMIIAVVTAAVLDIIFNYADNIGEASGCAFLVVLMFAVIIGLGVGMSYSEKPEHYHFVDETHTVIMCNENTFTLTKDASGDVVYNYIYDDGTGVKISGNIPADGNIVFEYSDTATPAITISDAVYNSKAAAAWFVDPTVRNIKIIAPKNSIVNTLY